MGGKNSKPEAEKIIDGKAIAATIREEIKVEVAELKAKYGKAPGLAVVIVGNRPDSQTYVRMKRKACDDADEQQPPALTCGMGTPTYTAPEIVNGEAYGVKADVFSLGVVLLELFHGSALDAWKNKHALKQLEEIKAKPFHMMTNIVDCVEVMEFWRRCVSSSTGMVFWVKFLRRNVADLYNHNMTT